MSEIRFECPSCSSEIELRTTGDPVECEACGQQHGLVGHLCPNCLTYYEAELAICLQCGEGTSRICAHCQTRNWAGYEFCKECGSSLDIVEQMPGRTAQGTRDRLRRQMLGADQLKQVEAEASQERMAEMMANEEERQIAMSRRMMKRREEERRMLSYALGGAAIVVLILLLLILLT